MSSASIDRWRLRVMVSLLAAGFWVLTVAGAQQIPSGPYRLSTSARLVVLDVVVLDRTGKTVPHLDASQFTVYEDGVAQTIQHVEASASALADAHAPTIVHGTADLAKIGNASVNILVFDELNSKFEDMAYARVEVRTSLLGTKGKAKWR